MRLTRLALSMLFITLMLGLGCLNFMTRPDPTIYRCFCGDGTTEYDSQVVADATDSGGGGPIVACVQPPGACPGE